jgi:glutathione S-transferase
METNCSSTKSMRQRYWPSFCLSATRVVSLLNIFLIFIVLNAIISTKQQNNTHTLAGDMTLYFKAGPDGTSIGDCPFAHFVRMTLDEKGLDYEVRPTTAATKPDWLVQHYEGKLPALRHRKECYVDSSVICDYLEFFFPTPALKTSNERSMELGEAVVDGFFPALAKYLKHTSNGDDHDVELRTALQERLDALEAHLQQQQTGPYLAGAQLTLLDLALAPKLYHMTVGLEAFKDNAINVGANYPAVKSYMDTMFARESFQKSVYPKETVEWGWGNARKA